MDCRAGKTCRCRPKGRRYVRSLSRSPDEVIVKLHAEHGVDAGAGWLLCAGLLRGRLAGGGR